MHSSRVWCTKQCVCMYVSMYVGDGDCVDDRDGDGGDGYDDGDDIDDGDRDGDGGAEARNSPGQSYPPSDIIPCAMRPPFHSATASSRVRPCWHR